MITRAGKIKDLIRDRSEGDVEKPQMLLLHFAMEKLLERPSVSDYGDDTIIKAAYS